MNKTVMLPEGTAIEEIYTLPLPRAKPCAADCVAVTEGATSRIEDLLQMREEMPYAFLRKEFSFLYQMQVDTAGHVQGVEALLRWNHPRQGILSPREFLNLAEHTGFVLPIGLLALDNACSILSHWQYQKALRQLSLTVNIGEHHFYHESFLKHLADTLERYPSFVRSLLIVETSELTLSRDLNRAADIVQGIRHLGVSISVDDYTNSYLSAELLPLFSARQVKVDMSFLRSLYPCKEQRKSVAAALHNNLSRHRVGIIAEGVETEEQFESLQASGYQLFQGFLFDSPVTLEKCTKFILDVQ